MRNAFADQVLQLAKENPNIILLSGDIGNKLFDKLRDHNESQFLNCGIAESNMIGTAAGLAMSGFIPIVYTITPFTTTRCYEQIRVDVAYHEAPVIIVGTGAGLSYSELGATHHSLEDMAILRCLPNMQILAPCDPTELKLALTAAARSRKPTYIRIGKKGEQSFYPDQTYTIGQAREVKHGTDVAILSIGTIINEAMVAADTLEKENISTSVINIGTLKPLDKNFLAKLIQRYKLIVSIEEHGIAGGLGSAIAECLAYECNRPKHLIVGTKDEFMHLVGSQKYARDYFGLTSAIIAKKIIDELK